MNNIRYCTLADREGKEERCSWRRRPQEGREATETWTASRHLSMKMYPIYSHIGYRNIIFWIVPFAEFAISFRSPRKAVSLEESGPSSTWHGTFLREIWWCFGRPNPHIHLSLDSLWIARNQSKSCYLCSGASRGTWFCSLFDSFIWSSRQVD